MRSGCMRWAHLYDDVVDEEVGGGGQRSSDDAGNGARAVDNDAQLAKSRAPQHSPQKNVPGGPVEEEAADAPVQAGQRRPLALCQRQPAQKSIARWFISIYSVITAAQPKQATAAAAQRAPESKTTYGNVSLPQQKEVVPC